MNPRVLVLVLACIAAYLMLLGVVIATTPDVPHHPTTHTEETHQ